ncbi:Histone-lysine N-methyltransferase SETMAR [Eumeta japonica]|uniref:Histone-lysine N-methyltransferase SETMAR n=1 Tax=Eumeta variegata TaxID=151549 RepID=A0A4C1WMQ4_EUMVA|nr:Histone-lysine N-methyltransferase SETMAR [Eumeta japonica]
MQNKQKKVTNIRSKQRGKVAKIVLSHRHDAFARGSAVAMAAIRNAMLGFKILEHPPYSSDLAPSDFYLFLRSKGYLKGKRFEDDETEVAAGREF